MKHIHFSEWMFRNSNGVASGTYVMFVSQLIQQTENTMLEDENVFFYFVTIYDKTEFSNKLFMTFRSKYLGWRIHSLEYSWILYSPSNDSSICINTAPLSKYPKQIHNESKTWYSTISSMTYSKLETMSRTVMQFWISASERISIDKSY